MSCIGGDGRDILPERRRSSFGALFSRTLPPYSGPHPVGVRHVESPVQTQTFGAFKDRSMPDGRVGITFDTVKFALFYPAELPTTTTAATAGVLWLPRLIQTVDGLLKVANWSVNPIYKIVFYAIVALLTWGTTFPGIEDAPLRAPSPESRKWRVVLYSHGAGCSWLMNSAVCGELASRGYIVAAIEHRDGTGPSVRMTNERGETNTLNWLNWSQLEWMELEEQPVDDATLRRVQLEVRLFEVDKVLEAIQRLTQGRGTGTISSQYKWEGWDVVEGTKPIIAGHSFGGSLAMAAASDRRFDFSHVIAFDPATQRLEPWDKEIPIPLLAVNSAEYARGEEFNKLLVIAPSAETHKIYIIPGATHASFTDVFLILPDHVNRWIGLTVDPWGIIRQTADTTGRFMEDQNPDTRHMVRCHAEDGLFCDSSTS